MIALLLLLAGILIVAYLATGPDCDCTRCERAHVKPEPWSKP